MLQQQGHDNHKRSISAEYNIESKTCERNSSSFACIEMYNVTGDKQAHFHSAS